MATITDNYFPGVHVIEKPFQPGQTSVADVTAFGAFVGRSDQGPTAPTEVRSWVEFTQVFGTNYTDLHNAVYDFFANGGRRCYIVRDPGVGGSPASLPIYADTVPDPPGGATPLFTITALNWGTWGNSVYAVTYVRDPTNYRFDLAIYKVPPNVTFDSTKRNDEYLVDQWNDVSLFPNDERYLYPLANLPSATGSKLVGIAGQSWDPTASNIPANRPMPGGVATKFALTAGANGNYSGGYVPATAYGAAITAMQSIPGPYILNLPNMTTNSIVVAAINDAAARGDVFVVCDPPLGQTVDQIITYANTDLNTNAFGSRAPSFAALYYPQVYMPAIGSTSPGRTALRPPGGAIVGAYMANDDVVGPWRTPAGRNYSVGGALQAERSFTEAELTKLNNANVNALRLLTGTGVAIMGGRTMKKYGADMYINVRRTVTEITRALVLATEVHVFDNNDERLWEQLHGVCDSYLNALFGAGGLKGGSPEEAYYVRCDETNNTASTVSAGMVNIEVGVSLLTPAEFIVITIGQFESGTNTVSTSL